MASKVRSNRWAQVFACFVACLFILGFFLDSIGAWTGPILAVWFIGTQRVRRGFLWMVAFNYIPSLMMGWRSIAFNGPEHALKYFGWTLLASAVAVLPFSFHRLLSPRLPGWFSTLPLPLAAVALNVLIRPELRMGAAPGSGMHRFLIFWFASVVVWMWNLEFKRASIGMGAWIFGVVYVFAAGGGLFHHLNGSALVPISSTSTAFAWACLGAAVALSIWSAFGRDGQPSWEEKPATVALLRSPYTGTPLNAISEHGREALAGSTGEFFPIRNRIPDFLKPEDLTGNNGKYNHLYETIGGFYDDTQRVACAIRGLDRDSYFSNYMDLLDVKPGDIVLETSVGTGLNFKYLPRGVKLFGLDLSREMLAGCQTNMRRWGMDANLFLGNAESLPFADSSFDVVYTAGAINFFNDREKAIREMIRVAKPGSLLMVEDETEEYVKSTYEKFPITGSLYKGRKEAVTVPIDLVPPEMEDIRVEMLKEGKFYAITFRKPVSV